MNYIFIVFLFFVAACSKPVYTEKNIEQFSDNATEITTVPLDNVSAPVTILVEKPILEDIYTPEFEISLFTPEDKELYLNYEYTIKEDSFDFPLVMNHRVEFYINYYSKKYPMIFQRWVERANKYIYMVKDILRREGLPQQLAVLPFAESGYNVDAYSHVGAGGMWQFMPATGKAYGLKINNWVDERQDFEKATLAAVRHLKDLYAQLGDWYLAIAAYNAGFYKIYNGVKKYKTKDFFQLSKYRYLKNETKDYVPKFIALSILYYKYDQYGFSPPTTPPLLYEKLNFSQPVNLFVVADVIGCSYDTLKELNPDLKKPITPPDDEYNLKIPYGKRDLLVEKTTGLKPDELLQVKIYYGKIGQDIKNIARKFGVTPNEIKALNGFRYDKLLFNTHVFVPIPDKFNQKYMDDFASAVKIDAPKIHIVKSGENLYNIAHKYGLSLNELISYNKGINPRLIKPGQPLVVVSDYKNSKKLTSKKTTAKMTRYQIDGNKYKVKAGDNLWSIASAFNTSVSKLKKLNKLRSSLLSPGKILEIPD